MYLYGSYFRFKHAPHLQYSLPMCNLQSWTKGVTIFALSYPQNAYPAGFGTAIAPPLTPPKVE